MTVAALHHLFLSSTGISTDTRQIEKGTLFFALKGDNFDGNNFAVQALKKGAQFAVVDRVVEPNERLIEVKDVLECLQELANFHRNYLKISIIGLTGSNGKTTTKELILAVLSKKINAVATKGNLNNHIGVPLTLLSMNASTEVGIVEMGANHPGEIAALCEIAEPDYGYITNFGKAHLEGFGGIEGVIKAKSELYDFLKKHGNTIFVNADDPLQMKQSGGTMTYSFGNAATADCKIEFVAADPFVETFFENTSIQSKLIGKYNAANIAAAIGIGNYFQVPLDKIKKGIEEYTPLNNRSQIIEKNGNSIILDAYNANPTSMAAAMESFASLKTTKGKVLILGDMFEVGKDAQKEHQRIIEISEKLGFDKVFVCGKNFFGTSADPQKTIRFEQFEDLKNYFLKHPISNAFFLIKGSRGMKLERVLEIV